MQTSITFRLFALYALVFTSSAAVAATNLITNGDFETPGTLTGWTVTPAASGSNIGQGLANASADMTQAALFGATGSDFDELSQTFATKPGAFYKLTFLYGPETGGDQPPAINGFNFLWNGASVGGPLFPQFDVSPGSIAPTYFLQATGSSTTLEFQGRNQPSFDFLDNVSVTAVTPDTGTSVPLLAIGLIGVVVTRRVLA